MRTFKTIIVQKYGGTSVATPEKIKKAAEHIKDYYEKGHRLLVVVSARGDKTDELMDLARKVSASPDSREMDKLLSLGEKESTALLAIALIAIGVPAISIDAKEAGLETSAIFGKAKIKKLQKRTELLEKIKGKVVVMAGFQGVAEGTGDITTLGRGGSDATAVAMAIFLGAEICEIYTDVDGVYAVDPLIVHDAKRFKTISYDQMILMAAAGAGVMMDRSVIMARNHRMPIRVLLSPSIRKAGVGTLITDGGDTNDLEGLTDKGIAIKKDVAVITITDIPDEPGEAKKIFAAIKSLNVIEIAQGISGGQNASISIIAEEKEAQTSFLALKNQLSGMARIYGGLSLLTIIDPTMKEKSGYFLEITTLLANEGINIEMITSAQTSLAIAIKSELLEKTATTLAKKLELLDA